MGNVDLLGIVASLRTEAVHASLASAAADLIGGDASISIHTVQDLPLYNGDDEAAGPPAPVAALYDAVRSADGVILFSPEYNSSLPAVTKNVIDWLSRDPSTWDATGITMATLSPGPRAGLAAREHFEAIMPRQASRLFPTIGFGSYGDLLDESGALADTDTRTQLAGFLADFAAFCATPTNDG